MIYEKNLKLNVQIFNGYIIIIVTVLYLLAQRYK